MPSQLHLAGTAPQRAHCFHCMRSVYSYAFLIDTLCRFVKTSIIRVILHSTTQDVHACIRRKSTRKCRFVTGACLRMVFYVLRPSAVERMYTCACAHNASHAHMNKARTLVVVCCFIVRLLIMRGMFYAIGLLGLKSIQFACIHTCVNGGCGSSFISCTFVHDAADTPFSAAAWWRTRSNPVRACSSVLTLDAFLSDV
jgi:hypothetical protein